MWIHEGFTTYSESLFIEYFYGKEAAAAYTRGLRLGIQNSEPLIGNYGVNDEGSSDMYSKGNNLLHTIRQVVNDDEKWRAILRGLNQKFYHQTVSTKDVEDYISEQAGVNLDNVFDQYLRDIRVPVFEYAITESKLFYRWTNCIESFDMPIKIVNGDEELLLKPKSSYQSIDITNKNLSVSNDYYIYKNEILIDRTTE